VYRRGVEYLSQLQTGSDVLVPPRLGDPVAKLGPRTRDVLAAFSAHRLHPDVELSWHRATRLTDGCEVLLPADRCPLLQPGPERAQHLLIDTTDPGAALRLIVARLEQFGIETFGLDLTRPRFEVAAARVIAPGLQLEPSEIVTPRLADMIARTGGGVSYTGGVALV
jgi:ribosomal protein S12 methylthiotransferase accessory factor YcaO